MARVLTYPPLHFIHRAGPRILPCPDGRIAGTLRIISLQQIAFKSSRHEADALGEEVGMTSPPEVPAPGTREHFLQVTALRRWGTIQDYVELCRQRGYFTDAFYRKATAHMERIHVRRMLRQVTDGRGWPTLANITREGQDGRPERVFMQEELFGPEEYRQVVAYHYGMARHHLFKAQTYRDHAKARYGLQLPLFSEDDEAV
jgi:hypothetical protein